jgi:hypothetical protein
MVSCFTFRDKEKLQMFAVTAEVMQRRRQKDRQTEGIQDAAAQKGVEDKRWKKTEE